MMGLWDWTSRCRPFARSSPTICARGIAEGVKAVVTLELVSQPYDERPTVLRASPARDRLCIMLGSALLALFLAISTRTHRRDHLATTMARDFDGWRCCPGWWSSLAHLLDHHGADLRQAQRSHGRSPVLLAHRAVHRDPSVLCAGADHCPSWWRRASVQAFGGGGCARGAAVLAT